MMKGLWKYLKNYRKEAFLAPFLKIIEVIFELMVPLIVSYIIDEGINGGRGLGYVVGCCLILVLFGALGFVSSVGGQYFAARAAVGFSKDLRSDMFRRIMSLSFSDTDRIGTSEMITRMTSDVNQIQTGVNMILRLILRSPVVVIGSLIMAIIISVKASIVFVITIVVILAVALTILFVTIPLYKKSQKSLDDVTCSTRETLTGNRVIRAFCREEDEKVSFEGKTGELYKSQTKAGRVSALLNPLTYAIINVAIIALIYVGAFQVSGGSLTQGNVVALYNYLSQILVELIKFANFVITVTKSFACAGRVSEILEMTPSAKHGEKTEKKEGAPFICFNNVSVRYGEGCEYALENVSFTVERGETIGIIGGTGAGKSTLVNLIPHFYDATEGEVLIDGVNVNAVGDRELRNMCGIVPQKAQLFTGTIRDNILWGAEADDAEIEDAVERAQAADIIASKKGGLDEPVEQGGKNFSGGQRQRLTIARALVRKAPVLILDDSASALDYATESRLRKSISELGDDTCVFIVSQRTSSLMNADRIIVLDGGKMVGYGTHSELLESCPVYREIHETQFGEA